VGQGITARGAYLLGDDLSAGAVQISNVDGGSSLTEQPRDRPTDPGARAGHDGRLAGEVTGVDGRRGGTPPD